MPSNRAGIFLPYDSLKGFRELLRTKETVVVSPLPLSEDQCEILNRRLRQITPGMMVTVVYEKDGVFLKKEGLLAKKDLEYQKTVTVVKTVIPVARIRELSCPELHDEEGS